MIVLAVPLVPVESSLANAHFNVFHAVQGNAEVGRIDVGARRRHHVLSMDDVILKPSHSITESCPSVTFGDAALSTVFEQERAVPDHLLPGFRWA
ncbi:hypothetical protein LB566_24790 [Mesorhizobium sp. CA13]|uniref:hypothetical protein n=1 Tax=unclassified Mesorhizobium TaxID=325217 RepID=UPI001126885E|nr:MULTISPECIES: hypothetical protein [unclassified Mesorhizobium]MBZ9857014.1 hypothetical protein [Mesorhizobium sp. CA13]MCA0014406.1 hypothetical protein [Mesorhizobium sp. B294B1A1]MCA0036433.1 hypothetical protein [Mesorhizobium sp. B292B1B]TPM42165.1 hypothetical protein FJ964_24920 [Mesorhizobium sp. B2-3-2]